MKYAHPLPRTVLLEEPSTGRYDEFSIEGYPGRDGPVDVWRCSYSFQDRGVTFQCGRPSTLFFATSSPWYFRALGGSRVGRCAAHDMKLDEPYVVRASEAEVCAEEVHRS